MSVPPDIATLVRRVAGGTATASWLPPHCADTLACRYRLHLGQLHAIALAYELAPRSTDLVELLAPATSAAAGQPRQPLSYASTRELVSTLDLLWPSVSALHKLLARLDACDSRQDDVLSTGEQRAPGAADELRREPGLGRRLIQR